MHDLTAEIDSAITEGLDIARECDELADSIGPDATDPALIQMRRLNRQIASNQRAFAEQITTMMRSN